MEILTTIFIGFLVGLVARFVLPGRDPGGFIVTILMGIAGSFIATYGGQMLGLYRAGAPAGFFGSVIGAVALLAIVRLFRR